MVGDGEFTAHLLVDLAVADILQAVDQDALTRFRAAQCDSDPTSKRPTEIIINTVAHKIKVSLPSYFTYFCSLINRSLHCNKG